MDSKKFELDPSVRAQLEQVGGRSFWEKLLQKFLVSATSSIVSLKQHWNSGSLKDLYAAAHQLKGSSGMVGAKRIEAFCKRIEEALRAQEHSPIQGMILQIEEELEQIKAHSLREGKNPGSTL